MNKILPTLAVAGLSMSSLLAQGDYYSPADLASTEGGGYAYYLGRYSTQQSHLLDGELRGKVANIKEVALRLDGRTYSQYTGMGRSWSSFTLRIGEGDEKTFGKVSAANITNAKTVFTGSLTWPSFTTGAPLTKPAVWGGITGGFRFPFTSPWLYLGKSDIVTDWQFSGGTLANAASWTSTRAYSYYFDGFANPSSTSASSTYVGNIPATRLNNNSTGVTGRCNDAGHGTTTTGAYMYGYAYVYNNLYSNYAWRGKFRYYSNSYYTGYDRPVIHAMGFQANATGLNINTGCNNLHITGPMLLTPMKTLPKFISTSGYSGYNEVLVPWNAAYGGVDLIFQAGWNDSVSGKIGLSQARHIRTPAKMPVNKEHKRLHSYTYATYSNGPFNYFYHNHALRYSY